MNLDTEPFGLFETINTGNTRIGLNPNRTYTFFHTGKTGAEVDDTNAIRFGFTEGIDLSAAGVGKDRGVIFAGQSFSLSGKTFVFVRAAAGTPMLMIKSGRLEGEMKQS